ncbi:hypothetical protein KIV35_05535 [Enterobacter roggenkampii]|nr:hypothetical protein [Enterobacter roggenkampii]MBS7799429.1 hypothetical protein [Enterobacter roggenkampii]MCK7121377.1 hypothetical protein [Enterobacter roggenkampii]MDK9946424.1 hypothetical protein [Enterobacter roggenkampii]
MIASLIIQEITSLVNTATSSKVLTFVGSGLTHEEYWRHVDPEEFADAHDCREIPNDTSPLEKMDIYTPQLSIARQSLWFDLDDYIDDFIISLAVGLIHTSDLSWYLS